MKPENMANGYRCFNEAPAKSGGEPRTVLHHATVRGLLQ